MNDLTSFTLYQADCVGREKNTKYPHLIRVSCADDLQKALSRDCVCARYRGSHRSNEDFIESDCLGMDIDNSHTENSADWVTPEDVHKLIPDVTMGVHYSRHHMKQKEGASPRPRFHVFFVCDRETNATKYRHLKERMQEILPFFDPKAMDAARFFYGSSDPVCDFIPGMITLNECLDMYYPEDDPATDPLANMAVPDYMSVPIHEGSRNATMSHFAGKLLKRLGPTEEAEAVFHQRAQACVPPLPEEELAGIWRSALGFYRRISKEEGYIQPAAFSAQQNGGWEDPLPFSKATCLPFPIDALPGPFAEYVSAVSESTQTPIDLAGTAALSIMATCLQGKYRIAGKPDWVEPLNLYVLGIALPSERKSAVLSAMLRPVNDYETSQNQMNAATLESNRMRRRVLERRQKAVEELVSKGKAEPAELDKIAEEITAFHEEKPLRLYVDDITPEKLVAVLAENDGRISLISSEGGIFDTLAGAYSKTVNIDVMLKGYSGDAIRVDRIGRESHSVLAPALNILLMAQPKVISDVLSNQNFRGRGLTARFLFCLPDSAVGHRKYRSQSVSEEARKRYDAAVFNLLSDEYLKPPELITLTPEADRILTKSITRFARNTVTTLETVRELKVLGVDVYFEEQRIHTMSTDGELMLTILASYAQEESRSASENQKWRIRKSYECGEIMCWRYMFGYDITKDSIEIDPEEAPIVREMYRRVIAGHSLSSICKWLNDNRYFGALGGRWNTPRLREALSNEKYLGNAMLQKTYVNNHLEKKVIVNTGELPKYYVTETHPAIIDQETFDAAQQALAAIAEKTAGRAKRTVCELTSLITCGNCGRHFKRVHNNGSVGWRCETFQTLGKSYCASKKIPEETLHQLLCGLLDMPIYDPGTVRSEVQGITVTGLNALTVQLKDGTSHDLTWKDRSRRESWTPEMKEKAREQMRRRYHG